MFAPMSMTVAFSGSTMYGERRYGFRIAASFTAARSVVPARTRYFVPLRSSSTTLFPNLGSGTAHQLR